MYNVLCDTSQLFQLVQLVQTGRTILVLRGDVEVKKGNEVYSRSPQNFEFGHFTQIEDGREMYVGRYITHVQSDNFGHLRCCFVALALPSPSSLICHKNGVIYKPHNEVLCKDIK